MFERRDLNSPQKYHPPQMILGKFVFFFVFNLRKQNVTHFSCISLTLNLCCIFKLLLPDTVRFFTSYQQWLIRQWFLISALGLRLVSSQTFSPTKQLYSKVGNSGMCQYGKSVFTSNFYLKLKNTKWRYQFHVKREFVCKNFF